MIGYQRSPHHLTVGGKILEAPKVQTSYEWMGERHLSERKKVSPAAVVMLLDLSWES
jgi:hypothetical protein